jgi:mercuric ion transport protein
MTDKTMAASSNTNADPADAFDSRGTRSGIVLSAGGILGALAASSCCVLPLVLVSVGITGPWMANLTVLAPYSPIFIGLTLLMLGLGYYFAYRRPKLDACATDGACGDTASRRATKVMLWIGTGLIALGIGFPYAAPLFY